MRIKTNYRCTNRRSGFVALFFVLSLAAALGVLVFGLIQKSNYTIILLQSMKNTDSAKFAAHYCLQKFIDAKVVNQGFRPVLHQDMLVQHDLYCRYEQYDEAFDSGNIFIRIIGSNSSAIYEVRRIYRLTDTL